MPCSTIEGIVNTNSPLRVGGRDYGVLRLSFAPERIAGRLWEQTLVALMLAMAFGGVSDAAWAQGALRGMGAVAAGLIMATGLKMMSTFAQNPLGRERCLLFALATFVAVAILRIPLAVVLLVLGTASCVWTWSRLRDKP